MTPAPITYTERAAVTAALACARLAARALSHAASVAIG